MNEEGRGPLPALLGGAVGVAAGAPATVVYVSTEHWAVVILPPRGHAIAAAIATGAIAGLLPALRAAGSRRPRRCGPSK